MLKTKEIAKILMKRYNTPIDEKQYSKINIAEAMEIAASFNDCPIAKQYNYNRDEQHLNEFLDAMEEE